MDLFLQAIQSTYTCVRCKLYISQHVTTDVSNLLFVSGFFSSSVFIDSKEMITVQSMVKKDFHKIVNFNAWLFIVMKTSQNREIKPSRICRPSPKSRKYLYAKYMAYTVSINLLTLQFMYKFIYLFFNLSIYCFFHFFFLLADPSPQGCDGSQRAPSQVLLHSVVATEMAEDERHIPLQGAGHWGTWGQILQELGSLPGQVSFLYSAYKKKNFDKQKKEKKKKVLSESLLEFYPNFAQISPKFCLNITRIFARSSYSPTSVIRPHRDQSISG